MARVDNLERWLKTGSSAPGPATPDASPEPQPTEPVQPLEGLNPAEPVEPAEPVAPAAAAPEPAKPNAVFREMAKLRKEIRELKEDRALAPAGGKAPAPPMSADLPNFEEAPFENIDQRIRRLTDAVGQLAAQNQGLMQQLTATNQESNYRANNPEYDAALKYLAESEEKIWAATDGLSVLAADLLDKNEALFEREAAMRGVPAEDLALEQARNQIIAGGRQQLMEIARRSGKAYPEVVVNAAKARGYGAAPVAPAATAPATAKARVEAAIERSRGSSLSTMEPQSSTSPTAIADRASLDEFLQTAAPEERARYINQRDQEDPGWFEKMFQR